MYAGAAVSAFVIIVALVTIGSLARPHAAIGIVLLALVWLVGLGAIIMLWRRDSSTYFTASKAR